jgi:hypothetical protein
LVRIIYILIFIIGLNFTSFSQNKPADVQQKLVKLYPVPASSVINFDFQKGYDRTYSLQIFNFMGKRVFEVKNLPSKVIVPLTDFFRGLYYYHIIDKNKRIVETGRFQVIK